MKPTQETTDYIFKQFIPFQETKELEELGFDKLCLIAKELQISKPLWQQAFNFFRENYNLFSSIEVDQTMEPKFCYSLSKYNENLQWDNISPSHSELYYTYEEAQLACLKKLIEIAKTLIKK